MDTVVIRHKMFKDALLKWSLEYATLRIAEKTHFGCVRMDNIIDLAEAGENKMEKVHRRLSSLPSFKHLENFTVEQLSTYLWLLENDSFEEAVAHLNKVKGLYETVRDDSK